MARAISDEELQLKRRARRRLIGAILLVVAVVVILPMVLDPEPKSSSGDISVRIPSPNGGVFTAKVKPLAAAPSEPVASSAAPSPPQKSVAPAVPAPEPVKAAPQPKPAPVKPAPAKPVAKATTASGKAPKGSYSVQVIALADAAKAKQMQGRIQAAGIPSYTEIVKTVKGDVTRVRAGPFATRVAAEKARDRLKALGMSGNIIAR